MAADWMAVPYLHARYGKGPPKPVGAAPSVDRSLRRLSLRRRPVGADRGAERTGVGAAVRRRVQRSGTSGTARVFLQQPARRAPRCAGKRRWEKRTSGLSSTELADRLSAARIAFGLVNGPEDLADHPAFRTDPATTAEGADYAMPAHPIHWLGEADETAVPPPALGAHTEAVTREFLGDAE